MTDEFKELTSRFMEALYSDSGSLLLFADVENTGDRRLVSFGSVATLTEGICQAINKMAEQLDDETAVVFRNRVKQELITDEERRFQKGENE